MINNEDLVVSRQLELVSCSEWGQMQMSASSQ